MIMDMAYGIKAEEAGPYISTAIAALESMAVAGTPGAFLVDTLPFRKHLGVTLLQVCESDQVHIAVKHVPEWVPGAGFKRKARHWSALREAMTENPFKTAKEKIVRITNYAYSY